MLTGPTDLPSLSIVICTLNRAHFLHLVLRAVVQCRSAFQELVVVMGPCQDETAQVLDTYRTEIDQRLTTDRANVSVARNLGLQAATHKIVLYLDDDVIPSIPWIMTHRLAHQDQRYAVVAGAVADCSQPERLTLQFAWGVQDHWSRTHPVLSRSQQQWYLQQPGWFPGVMGANVSYWRAAVLAVGGFDEFYEYFLEETDLCLRLLKAGYRVHHCDYVVEHYVQPSHNRQERDYLTCWYALGKNTTYFARKHRRDGVPDWFFWWRLSCLLSQRCGREILRLLLKGRCSPGRACYYLRDTLVGMWRGWLAQTKSIKNVNLEEVELS
ncbi:MAG: glycosyltransferase family 2 protein [Spirulinaceae cyanobacterium]